MATKAQILTTRSDTITQDKPDIIRDLKKLSPADLQEIEKIKASLKWQETDSVLQFGVEAQKEISIFADQVLEHVRARDMGDVGKLLNDMSLQIRGLNVNSITDHTQSFVEKIPLIGKLFDEVARFVSSYEKIEAKIENITLQMKSQRTSLLKDIILLDQFYDENLKFFDRLNLYIYAGQQKLDELKKLLQAKQAEIAKSTDSSLLLQDIENLKSTIDRLDKRIYDLMLTKTISLQTMPQIKLIQSNDMTLAEKIQSSLLSTIPIWKNQVVIAVSIFRQKRAVELQKDVAETTNSMLSKNSELLKQGSIKTATETQRGVVELETLKKVNQNLIDTITETLKIQAEGMQKRSDATEELTKIESDLKSALINANSNTNPSSRIKNL